MARKRYNRKQHKYDPVRQAPVKPEPAGPARSAKMQALMAEADRMASEPACEPGGFVPKPRAIRRFEKYAGMGGE